MRLLLHAPSLADFACCIFPFLARRQRHLFPSTVEDSENAAEATTEDTDSENKNVYVADVYQSLTLRSEASADSDAITDLEPMTHLEVLEFTAGTNYAYVEVLSGEKKSYKGYVNSDYITKLGEPTVRIGTEE